MYVIEEVKLKKAANTNNVDSRPMILTETPTDKVLRHVLDQLLSRLSFETRQHLSADHLVKPSKMETNHSDPSITDENSGIPLTVTTTIRHVQSHPSMAPSPTGPGSTRSLGNLNKDIMSHGKNKFHHVLNFCAKICSFRITSIQRNFVPTFKYKTEN